MEVRDPLSESIESGLIDLFIDMSIDSPAGCEYFVNFL